MLTGKAVGAVAAAVLTALGGLGSTGDGAPDLGSAAPDSAPRASYVNAVTVPNDLSFDGQLVGGLSGIDYAADLDEYVTISDNRGESGPVRLYTHRLPIVDGRLAAPQFDTLVPLLDTNGQPYAPRAADTESVRWTPDRTGYLYTSEGEAKRGVGGFIREATLDGHVVRDLPLPDAFQPKLDGAGTLVSGIRDNLGFEAMTLSKDGATVTAVSENALVQDGPETSPTTGSPSRLVRIDRTGGRDLGEYVYPVDQVPAPADAKPGTYTNGVAEIIPAGPDSYLTLERNFVLGKGFSGKIYWTTTAGAENVAGKAAVTGSERPMTKKLVFDFASLGADSDCIEGMTWGPRLPDGSRSLVLAADNNFGLAGRTTFHLLAVAG